ncbi:MAG: methylcrotonoyl-CoA carboxylase, partial [Roseibium sp.]|uniref:carboxyl transferase domain-containing protein n=1 Tax=Roseibium sp. TaxID=1936156 RepID=UPI00260DF4B4
MSILKSNLSPKSEQFAANKAAHETAMDTVKQAARTALDGGGDTARQRHISRGKILPRERVSRLLDPGSPFLEVGMLAAHEMYDGAAPAAGMIAGIGRVEGQDVMILAN